MSPATRTIVEAGLRLSQTYERAGGHEQSQSALGAVQVQLLIEILDRLESIDNKLD